MKKKTDESCDVVECDCTPLKGVDRAEIEAFVNDNSGRGQAGAVTALPGPPWAWALLKELLRKWLASNPA